MSSDSTESEEDLRAAIQHLLALRDVVRRAVTHDLRTPLAVMMGQAELIEAGIARPTAPATITRHCERMTTMLSELGDRVREPVPGLTLPEEVAKDAQDR